jgi:predicted  nucleic acid-binding Zn-ribbon protein
MDDMETEIIRLTTELAMAKAELDGAYGSRSERAKEVTSHPEFQELEQKSKGMNAELEQLKRDKSHHESQMAEMLGLHQNAESRAKSLEGEIVTLREIQASGTRDDGRMRALEKELGEMASDYQDLTRETVEMEKEREKLDSVIDGLRDKLDQLEMQLGDERVRWLGVRSPGGTPDLGAGRETTSTMVLRNEFKKMMRETRAEGVKLLRVSTVTKWY